MAHTPPSILHQEDVESVILSKIEVERIAQNVIDEASYADRGTTVISSPTAPGAAYVQAEVASLKTAIDQMRAALTAAGITA